MKRQNNSRPRGFTLIELLVVVAIIAMLAAIGFAAMQFAMNKSREKDTVALIQNFSRAIKDYKDDHGNYPRPADGEETTTVDSQSYAVGGAKMLYQVLSGDGDNALKGGEKISTGEQASAKDEKNPSAGKIYLDTVVPPTEQMKKDKKPAKYVEPAGDESYFVVDPWRHPLQYQVPDRDKNGVITNDIKMFSSSDYELWSYGTLKKPDDSEESQKKWITNWGLK